MFIMSTIFRCCLSPLTNIVYPTDPFISLIKNLNLTTDLAVLNSCVDLIVKNNLTIQGDYPHFENMQKNKETLTKSLPQISLEIESLNSFCDLLPERNSFDEVSKIQDQFMEKHKQLQTKINNYSSMLTEYGSNLDFFRSVLKKEHLEIINMLNGPDKAKLEFILIQKNCSSSFLQRVLNLIGNLQEMWFLNYDFENDFSSIRKKNSDIFNRFLKEVDQQNSLIENDEQKKIDLESKDKLQLIEQRFSESRREYEKNQNHLTNLQTQNNQKYDKEVYDLKIQYDHEARFRQAAFEKQLQNDYNRIQDEINKRSEEITKLNQDLKKENKYSS